MIITAVTLESEITMTNTTTFDTSHFEASHLRRPRGDGSWAFATSADVAAMLAGDDLPEGIEWRTGMYSAVKRTLPPGHWIVLP
jgi:hypothetical protein